MGQVSNIILKAMRVVVALPRQMILQPLTRRSLASCGVNFHLGKRCDLQCLNNISVGNNVSFGPNTRIWTTGARVKIGDDVMFGPAVTIISGDHRTDLKGKPMREVSAKEKLPENDLDVVIEDDVWIGANVTILKGVTIPRGSVIAAGSVVTKTLVEEYSIWGGTPAHFIRRRFN